MSESQPPEGLDSELESFRQQWLSDLRTRKPDAPAQPPSAAHHRAVAPPPAPPLSSSSSSATAAAGAPAPAPPPSRRPAASSPTRSRRPAPPDLQEPDEDDYFQSQSFDDPPPAAVTGHTLDGSVRPAAQASAASGGKLVSALDHYEEAMEKEAQGSMGDSLKLYRQAYRLDHRVDKRYREKHFPAAPASKPRPASSSAAAEPHPPAPSGQGGGDDEPEPQPLSTPDLIASFAALAIEPLPPHVDGDPPPPCPIASLPSELLVHVLADLAADDPAALATAAALTCKRFAYLAATEQRLWRRVALGARWGFAGMHYRFARTVEWGDLDDDGEGYVVLNRDEAARLVGDDGDDDHVGDEGTDEPLLLSADALRRREARAQLRLTASLVPSAAYPSWRDLFRTRPRIRFNGCYISTVNYIRQGQMSTNQATWGGAPVHIVTYYRYLRFFRDGTCVSLLTTDPPRDVVHHLTREALLQQRREHQNHHHHHQHQHQHQHHHGHGAPPAASAPIMRNALKGRWRLSASLRRPPSGSRDPLALRRASTIAKAEVEATATGPAGGAADEETALDEFEGDVFVETEGVGPKYMYRMDLALRSAGKGARNNKLVWRGFHSYNKLTDDWAEFQLRNDKHFFFSRVKSYGVGE